MSCFGYDPDTESIITVSIEAPPSGSISGDASGSASSRVGVFVGLSFAPSLAGWQAASAIKATTDSTVTLFNILFIMLVLSG